MNTNHVTGISVVSIGTGERLGSISEILLDPTAERISAFAIDTGGGGMLSSQSGGTQWIDAGDVRAIGPDAMTVEDSSVLHEPASDGDTTPLSVLSGQKVVTEGGTFVGQVASVEIDENGMDVTGLDVSPGFFKSNRVVPRTDVLTVGEEMVIVSDSVCADGSAMSEPDDSAEPEGMAEETTIYGAPHGEADEQ